MALGKLGGNRSRERGNRKDGRGIETGYHTSSSLAQLFFRSSPLTSRSSFLPSFPIPFTPPLSVSSSSPVLLLVSLSLSQILSSHSSSASFPPLHCPPSRTYVTSGIKCHVTRGCGDNGLWPSIPRQCSGESEYQRTWRMGK